MRFARVFLILILLSFSFNAINGAAKGRAITKKPEKIKWEYGTIEYSVEGNGYPVVIAHGGGGGYDQGLLLGNTFFSGHQIISISRFGYLGSSLPINSNNKLQADAYAKVLSKLDIKQAMIVGTSCGGSSAIEFAINYPEKCSGLILMSALNNPSLKEKREMGPFFNLMFNSDLVYNLLSGLFRGKLLEKFGVSKSSQKVMTPAEKEYIQEMLDAMKPITQRKQGMLNDLHLPVIDEAKMASISEPILIFHAEDDLLVPFKNGAYAAKTIPNSQFVKFAKGGHLLLTHHEEIKKIIKTFAEKVEKGAANGSGKLITGNSL